MRDEGRRKPSHHGSLITDHRSRSSRDLIWLRVHGFAYRD